MSRVLITGLIKYEVTAGFHCSLKHDMADMSSNHFVPTLLAVTTVNNGLCCFITEVKQPDGEPVSAYNRQDYTTLQYSTLTCFHPLDTSDVFSRLLLPVGYLLIPI